MVVVFLGDIFGSAGRKALRLALHEIRERFKPDFILANVENLAGGRGVTIQSFNEMKALGINGFTSGNHIWDNREAFDLLDKEEVLFRPANYPDWPTKCPGRGYGVIRSGEKQIFIINVLGRLFMDNIIDCPFMTVEKCLTENYSNLPIIVDMHAEATSEKYAMGWFLDGRVSAVIGTHTHVQTADERILPQGTAYISDVGMCGSFDSVIGIKIEPVVKRFLSARRANYGVAKKNLVVCGMSINLDSCNKAISLDRFRLHVKDSEES